MMAVAGTALNAKWVLSWVERAHDEGPAYFES